jgi:hypothetical protein
MDPAMKALAEEYKNIGSCDPDDILCQMKNMTDFTSFGKMMNCTDECCKINPEAAESAIKKAAQASYSCGCCCDSTVNKSDAALDITVDGAEDM